MARSRDSFVVSFIKVVRESCLRHEGDGRGRIAAHVPHVPLHSDHCQRNIASNLLKNNNGNAVPRREN